VSDRLPELTRPWLRRDRPLPRTVLQPIAEFLHTEAAGGILLLVAAIAALAWANSPWSASYESFWGTELTVEVGPWHIEEHLSAWVNDLLMALFFYVVGLEIKRELLAGELRDRRAAALPAVAALGGMIVPALLYVVFNTSGEEARGWGIPMATDIAFAVGVLSLFSKRIPRSLTLFVLALAIVDDIGAIAVIAIFYTESIDFGALGAAVGLLGLMVAMLRLGIRAGYVYVVLGLGVWLATFQSGVHATIAGVALGFITPHRPFHLEGAVGAEAKRIAERTADDTDRPRVGEWIHLARISRQAISPLSYSEEMLHPWTSYVILPLFALANAGVNIGEALEAGLGSVALGIVVGLVGGKIAGISLASWLAVRTGLGQLPRGVGWSHITGAAAVAGIGFTVSLFVTGLAFTDPELIEQAKIGVLGASVIAAGIGLGLLARASRRSASP